MNQTPLRDLTLDFQSPGVNYNPQFVNFGYWTAILNFEDKLASNIRSAEKVLYLNDPSQWKNNSSAHKKAPIVWENDSHLTVLDFSISCAETSTEVFRLKVFPPKKPIQLDFKKEGDYIFSYWIPSADAATKGNLKILSLSGHSDRQIKSFQTSFKPNWY